jgi:arylsulfatase A-like enzyme
MSLGEHNRTGKSNINDNDDRRWPLYPEIAHIPFMLAAPGLEGGRTVDLIAQPVDILPTLLDLAGLDIDPPTPFHGHSFAPSLRGESQDPIHDFVVGGGFIRKHGGRIRTTQTTPVLYTDKWAYVPIGPQGERELFDLTKDPYAEVNVADDHPQVVKSLHEALIQWLHEIDAPPEAVEAMSAGSPESTA